ncbi:LegC family aminotransferase [Roseivirga pacifica]
MDNRFRSFCEQVKSLFGHQEFIPLHEPRFWGNEQKYLSQTIESTFVSSVGAFVDNFESEFASFTQTNRAVAVVNGTAALQVSLRLAGVAENDEVITQSLTFVATANAITYNHAHPVFVDVDLQTMGMSATALRDFLEEFAELREDGCYNKSSGRRIAACMPMHTFGFMCQMDQITAICSKWHIPVVEDSAEALGSSYKGKPAGSFGTFGSFSFNGNKIITSGGGGAIVSNDVELGNKAKYLTTTAKVPHRWEYYHDELGYNFRMPNLNAALICAQLENFALLKESKKELYEDYRQCIADYGLSLKAIPEDTDWNYWLMSVELDGEDERDAFLKCTNDLGVMTRPIWQLMHRLPMYADCRKDSQVNAEYLEKRIVNIPSSARKVQ